MVTAAGQTQQAGVVIRNDAFTFHYDPVLADASRNIASDLDLVDAVMRTGGLEVFGKFSPGESPMGCEGGSVKGAGIDLSLIALELIVCHCATVDKKGQTNRSPISGVYSLRR
ncbi:MAG: hypothetical protein J7559_16930 [Cohnella sp.]|nr:hypothetical protein [Cohnella sp.]